jgi:hypothetical protein
MSHQRELTDYLNGSDETQARRRLAAEGPDIIPELLEVLPEVVKAWGRYAATQASSASAEDQIDRTGKRASELVEAIASVSSQQATKAADRLVDGMHNRSASIRTVAALLCVSNELPASAYLQTVVQRFGEELEYLPKLAATICIAADRNAPERVLKLADGVASDWVRGYVLQKYPNLAYKVQGAVAGEDEWLRTAVIGMGAVYREIALRQ